MNQVAQAGPTGGGRRAGWAVAVVLARALGARLGYVLTLGDDLTWDDARHYDRIARNFLQGRGLILDQYRRVERPPLYPLLLAGVYLVNHHLGLTGDLLLVRLTQALLGAATVLLIWWTARRLFGERGALWAALIAAGYPFFIYYTGVLLSETLAVFLVALLLATTVAMWEERALHYPVAAGATLGLLCLTRSSFLLLPMLVVAVWLVVRRPRRRALLESVLMVVVWAGVMVPWVARNAMVTGGRFVPGTLTAGWSLYEAAGPGADGGPRMERIQWPEAVWPRETSSLDEYQADRYVRRLALEHIRREPARTARLALTKLGRFWNLVPNFSGYRSPLYLVVSVLGYVPVVVLAAVGAVGRRGQWRRWLMLVVPAAYLSAIHAVFVGSIRYRVPAVPGLVMLAGVGAAVVLGRWWGRGGGGRRRRWPWLVVGVLVAVVGAAVVGVRVLLRPENVRARLQQELARLWGARATVGEARFGPWSGLEARRVVLYSSREPNRPILQVTRLGAAHDPRALARGRLVLTDVDIEGGQLLLRRTPRGWDLPEGLLARRAGPQAAVPRVVVRGLRLRLEEEGPGGRREAALGRLNLLARRLPAGTLTAEFRLRSEPLGDWRGRASLSPQGDTLSLEASSPRCPLTEETLAALPEEVAKVLRKFAPRGEASLEVSAQIPLDGGGGPVVTVAFKGPSLAYYKFPYRLGWTRGEVRFAEGRATVTQGEGSEGELRVTLTGSISLPGRAKEVDLRMEATRGRMSPKLRDSLPSRYHRLWDDLRPEGTFDLTAWITANPDTQGRTQVALEVRPTDSTLNYVGFPYPVRFRQGTVDYEQGTLRTQALEGETPGGAPLSLSGTVRGLDTSRPLPHLLIRSPRLPLDEALRGALAAPYRELWDRLQPQGFLEARGLITRTQEGQGPVGVEVTARLLGATITDREFPYRLSDLRGQVSFAGGKVVLSEVRGNHGPAQVRLSGELRPGSPTRVELQVTGAQLPLDEDLRRALPEPVQKVWDKLHLAGTVDVSSRLSGPPEALQKTIDITTTDASLRYEGFPYPLRNLAGQLHYEEGQLSWDLKTRQDADDDGVRISTFGRADGLPQQPVARWGVVAENLSLDETLSEAIAQQPLLSRIWQQVEVDPGARANLGTYLRYENGSTVVERVEVDLTEARGLFRLLPYPFERITGKVTYEPGVITLEGLRGERAGGWVEVRRGRIDNLLGEPSFELQLSAQNFPLDEHLRALLPPGHRDLWDRLAPSGYLDFPKDVVTVSGGPTGPDERVITYHGDLGLKDVAFTLGLEFQEVTGKLSLSGQVVSRRPPRERPPGEARGEGQARPYQVASHRYGGTGGLTRMVASNKLLTNVTGSFLKEGDMLGFSNVTAQMYGGRLQGAVRLDLKPGKVTYGSRVNLEGLNLGPFVRHTFEYQGEELEGRLSGEVVLQGIGPSRRELVGEGKLTIAEGKLYRMPVLLRILNLLQLSPPRKAAFSRAAISYYLVEENLVINELNLWGRGLNIFGSGTVTPDNQLDLTLYSGFGRGQFPHIPVLSDAVELVGKQLVRLQVAGSFGEPEVTVEPLSPLSAPLIGALRQLLK